jgi:hypothetical protein
MRTARLKHRPRAVAIAFATTIVFVGLLSLAPAGSAAAATGAPLPPPGYAEAAASPDWVLTPAGLVYKSCAHVVPNNAVVSADGSVVAEGVTTRFAACPYSDIVRPPAAPSSTAPATSRASTESLAQAGRYSDGWWTGSWWNVPGSYQITGLQTPWSVPPNPTSNGATVFLFPSVEPSNSLQIVQPVLQWGPSDAGGGNYWGLASWYVNGASSYTTGVLQTSAGHSLIGSMTRPSGTSVMWSIKTTDATTGQYELLSAGTQTTNWNTGQGAVLEVYYASSCTQLPNVSTGLHFGTISVSTNAPGGLIPAFTPTIWNGYCSSSASAGSNYTNLYWVPGA